VKADPLLLQARIGPNALVAQTVVEALLVFESWEAVAR